MRSSSGNSFFAHTRARFCGVVDGGVLAPFLFFSRRKYFATRRGEIQ